MIWKRFYWTLLQATHRRTPVKLQSSWSLPVHTSMWQTRTGASYPKCGCCIKVQFEAGTSCHGTHRRNIFMQIQRAGCYIREVFSPGSDLLRTSLVHCVQAHAAVWGGYSLVKLMMPSRENLDSFLETFYLLSVLVKPDGRCYFT